MIRVYYLPEQVIDGIKSVKGEQFIHHAILNEQVLIQDTTDKEHKALLALALSWREPTNEEFNAYYKMFGALPAKPLSILSKAWLRVKGLVKWA